MGVRNYAAIYAIAEYVVVRHEMNAVIFVVLYFIAEDERVAGLD